MEDSKIVELYLCRDETAISRTAEKYGSRLRALAFGIAGDAHTAEECENDTYMGAWNSIPPHEPRDYLYAFLARITRHLALNRCRDRSALKRSAFICELSTEMEQCIPSPGNVHEHMEGVAIKQAINGFLGTINREKRKIFMRRYWYLDSVAEISRRYGLSESKVKTVLHRCRKQLREYLEKEGFSV